MARWVFFSSEYTLRNQISTISNNKIQLVKRQVSLYNVNTQNQGIIYFNSLIYQRAFSIPINLHRLCRYFTWHRHLDHEGVCYRVQYATFMPSRRATLASSYFVHL